MKASKFEEYGLDQLVACRKPGPSHLWAMKIAVVIVLGSTIVAGVIALLAAVLR